MDVWRVLICSNVWQCQCASPLPLVALLWGCYTEPLISHNAGERERREPGAQCQRSGELFLAASCCRIMLRAAECCRPCAHVQPIINCIWNILHSTESTGRAEPSRDLWVSSLFLHSLAPIVIGGVSGACARLSVFLFLAGPGQDAWVGYSRTAINHSRGRQPGLHFK